MADQPRSTAYVICSSGGPPRIYRGSRRIVSKDSVSQHRRAFHRQHSVTHHDAVIEPWIVVKAVQRAGRPRPGIDRAEHQTCDASVQGGAGAHRTWLNGRVERRPRQPMIADLARGLPESEDFRVRRRIAQRDRRVVRAITAPSTTTTAPYLGAERENRPLPCSDRAGGWACGERLFRQLGLCRV